MAWIGAVQLEGLEAVHDYLVITMSLCTVPGKVTVPFD
jgi:hypothetical protein